MRGDKRRTDKYRKKIRGLVLPGQKARFTQAVKEQVEIENKVKTILQSSECAPTILHHFYVAFAKRIARLNKLHKGKIFEKEANIELNKWLCRNLNLYLLTKILNISMGICDVFVRIWDGITQATITPEGYLDVKAHTPEKCFTADYAGAQTDQVIITPAAGKRIEVVSNYVSTENAVGDITLKFTGAAQPFFKLYTKTKTEAVGNIVCAKGDVNQTVEVTCPAKTFVSIGYDEI